MQLARTALSSKRDAQPAVTGPAERKTNAQLTLPRFQVLMPQEKDVLPYYWFRWSAAVVFLDLSGVIGDNFRDVLFPRSNLCDEVAQHEAA